MGVSIGGLGLNRKGEAMDAHEIRLQVLELALENFQDQAERILEIAALFEGFIRDGSQPKKDEPK